MTLFWPALLALGVAWLLYVATVAADTALSRINRFDARRHSRLPAREQAVNSLLERRRAWTSTAVLLRVGALLGSGAALVLLIDPRPAWGWLLLLGAAWWLLLSLSQLLARLWVQRDVERAAISLTGFMRATLWLLTPVTALLGPVAGRLHGGPEESEDAIMLSDDGVRLILPNDGDDSNIEDSEKEMITSILEMDETVAREVMVPRIDMVAVEADVTFDEALDVIIAAGHSRLPVYDDSVDQIIGVLYAKDLLRCYQQQTTDRPLRTLVRPAYFVPLTKNVKNLLAEMRKHRVHIAIVVDEYGGTAGLVTIEDILEEIVGEIQDEYDAVEEILVEREADNAFLVSARLDLYSLGKVLDVDVEEEDFDTVGGMVLGLLGHVAEVDEQVEHLGWRFTVVEVDGRRIEQVRAEPIAPPAPPAPPPAADKRTATENNAGSAPKRAEGKAGEPAPNASAG